MGIHHEILLAILLVHVATLRWVIGSRVGGARRFLDLIDVRGRSQGAKFPNAEKMAGTAPNR
jgi:hypothetical protein